jgi:predicted TIM-barrel fold metal-dependent hydrolase
MPSRRDFLKTLAGASAGALFLPNGSSGVARQQARQATKHAPVMVAGRRVKTIDVHCHVDVPGIAEFLKGTPLERNVNRPAPTGRQLQGVSDFNIDIPLGPQRLQKMDEMGIDVQAVSINAFWYSADRDLASRLINFQNEKLAGMVKAANPERFVAFASVALQFPELAAKQMEEGIKRWGLRGAAIGGSVPGEELSSSKFDPFWAKAEEMQALIFMHPQNSAMGTGIWNRVQGNGVLGNVIGNPLETTIFLSHMIMEGTLDRFPNLKICAAHGGGYLPSYADRLDHGCVTFPDQCNKKLKKKPTEYLRDIYVDSLVFSPEALRHLVSVVGADHIGLGTDYPYPWTSTPVDHVMTTAGLSDGDRAAVLGGTMSKLLRISA